MFKPARPNRAERSLRRTFLATILAALLIATTFAGILATPASAGHTSTEISVCSSGCDFTAIQPAIDHAHAGDTIRVGAGAYPLSTYIAVNKPLTILGPQAGVDPRPSVGSARVPGSATEATLDRQGGLSVIFWIQANDVTIDGLDMLGSKDRDMIITADPYPVARAAIRNNIVRDAQGAEDGIQLRVCTDCVVERNLVFNIPDTGISVNRGPVGVTVRDNELHSIHGGKGAIYVYGPASGIDVVGNLVRDGSGDGVRILCSPGSGAASCAGPIRVRENTIRGMGGAGVRVTTDSTPVQIERNSLRGNGGFGVLVTDVDSAGGHVQVNLNDMAGNAGGVSFTVPGSYAGPDLDATDNWWGAPSGPTHASNPGGTGLTVSDRVDYAPWSAEAIVSGPIRILEPALQTCAPTGRTFGLISSALACALPGATILLDPGVYPGALRVDKDDVTLCRTKPDHSACEVGPADAILDGAGAIYPVWIAADGVTLAGVTVRNPTFTAADQHAGPVDPSLIVVEGDRASIVDSVLTDLAARPGPGETRWYTIGVNIVTGAEDATLLRTTITGAVPAIGPGGACPAMPCRVFGVLKWGVGSGVHVEDSVIDLGGADAPATGIGVGSAPGVLIRGNQILLPAAPLGSEHLSVGIRADVSEGAIVDANRIEPATHARPLSITGIEGAFRNSLLSDNTIRGAMRALVLEDAEVGGNSVEANRFAENELGILAFGPNTRIVENTFTQQVRAILLDQIPGTAGPIGAAIHLNSFRQSGTTLAIASGVLDLDVNARENDWGAYRRDLIEAAHDDDGTGNTVDIACYIDRDGTTRVCPTAAIRRTVTGSAWPRVVQFDDVSTSGGRSIASRTWTMPDGSTSEAVRVTRSLGPGTYTVHLRVTDTEGFTSLATHEFTLANTAPVLSAPATRDVAEGSLHTLALVASDAETDRLRFLMTGAPASASLNADTGVFTWTPAYTDHGRSYAVTFEVSDGAASATATTTFTVVDVAVPPTLAAPGALAVQETRTLAVDVTAHDPDGGIVVLTASDLPGATFTDRGDNTGRFTWAAPVGSAGTHVVTFTATAANGMTAEATLTITVTQPAAATLERVTAFRVVASPSEVAELQATLTNTGIGTDSFAFTTTASNVGTPWTVGRPATQALASGEAATIRVPVSVPAAGGVSTITLRACSAAQPGVCFELVWHVDTPLKLELAMAPRFAPTDPIHGIARVTWANGAPAEGIPVALRQQATRGDPVAASAVSGKTGPQGTFAYELTSPFAKLPGAHRVFGSVQHGVIPQATSQAAYEVVLG